jgi:hypothetical protein
LDPEFIFNLYPNILLPEDEMHRKFNEFINQSTGHVIVSIDKSDPSTFLYNQIIICAPSIISTITGTGNFASASFGSSQYITFIIGGFNLFAGILATIATYTGVAQKLESHRFSSVAWDKFSRKLQIELAKSRSDRVRVKDFIKQSAEEYDRLIEMSPILPNDIIRWFTNMVETGEFDEELGECSTFCFECFCFPCGCSFCKLPCCQGTKNHQDIEIKKQWSLIELPEVIGRIKPTEIAEEPVPETPPPLVIIKKSIETTHETKHEENPYDVYNLSSSFSDNNSMDRV